MQRSINRRIIVQASPHINVRLCIFVKAKRAEGMVQIIYSLPNKHIPLVQKAQYHKKQYTYTRKKICMIWKREDAL
jgi:hypothetical protein